MGGAGVGDPGYHPAAGLGVLGRYWWLRGTVAGPASAPGPATVPSAARGPSSSFGAHCAYPT